MQQLVSSHINSFKAFVYLKNVLSVQTTSTVSRYNIIYIVHTIIKYTWSIYMSFFRHILWIFVLCYRNTSEILYALEFKAIFFLFNEYFSMTQYFMRKAVNKWLICDKLFYTLSMLKQLFMINADVMWVIQFCPWHLCIMHQNKFKYRAWFSKGR